MFVYDSDGSCSGPECGVNGEQPQNVGVLAGDTFPLRSNREKAEKNEELSTGTPLEAKGSFSPV